MYGKATDLDGSVPSGPLLNPNSSNTLNINMNIMNIGLTAQKNIISAMGV
jgi:hypothetical protein